MNVLQLLQERELLGSLDVAFALRMGQISDETNDDVLLALALVSKEVMSGQVCLDIAATVQSNANIHSGVFQVPSLQPWLEALQNSSLVGNGAISTPLVLDGAGRLYFHRYWNHEQRLANYIRHHVQETLPLVNDKVLLAGLQRLFPPLEKGEFDYQRLAAFMAVRRRFCVISGGPGTGKTYTLVKILALLIEQAMSFGAKPLRISLLAPTGKAAVRMLDSIRSSKGTIDCSKKVREAMVDTASTIHRALGSLGGKSIKFFHHAQNPLETDLVLVDEASMVNLSLMRRLTDALPKKARLILLGDMNQLASVEAGAVLGDICNTGRTKGYSNTLHFEIAILGGPALPQTVAPEAETGLWDCVASLQKSYRFNDTSGIGQLAKSIQQGDTQRAFTILNEGKEACWVQEADSKKLHKKIVQSAIEGYRAYLGGTDVESRFALFDSYRILCGTRIGSFGYETINDLVRKGLCKEGLIEEDPLFFEGRPILVTKNNYELSLFNGDIGMLVSGRGNLGKDVVFLGTDGKERRVSFARMEDIVTVFAMTVHKSQGSEFSEVDVVLPDVASSIVTRELLYTAVTRAKRKVRIFASEKVIRHAIETPTHRISGLRPALWGETEPREEVK